MKAATCQEKIGSLSTASRDVTYLPLWFWHSQNQKVRAYRPSGGRGATEGSDEA